MDKIEWIRSLTDERKEMLVLTECPKDFGLKSPFSFCTDDDGKLRCRKCWEAALDGMEGDLNES